MVPLIIFGLIVLLVLIILVRTIRVIQQGLVGVVKRLGQFHSVRNPGVTFLVPFVDTMELVDMRETPRTGDRQDVITKDNVSVVVNATIFSQVVDPRMALFSVSSYILAVDQLSRTTLRAVFGEMTLDECLSQREQINARLQMQMESVTDKWGVRINRVEILDIVPPQPILQAMALQKQADQEKRAAILQSEGAQQSQINVAEGQKQAQILEAEGRSQAIGNVYAAINAGNPTPELIAVLQLDTMSRFAYSPNSKVIVPMESAGLLGAVQALKSVLDEVPTANGSNRGGGAGTRGPSSPR
jgi:regulator of protease activity HflC (stomatin/prohibitin superfamily)